MRKWEWKIIDYPVDLLAKQTNDMTILPINCYNDEGNDLMATKEQHTQVSFDYKSEKNNLHTQERTSKRLQDKQSIF